MNNRTTSFMSAVVKILERIVVAIICHLEDNTFLSDRQYGYRSSHSTSDLLISLSMDWQDSLDSILDTLVIALIITGVFDQVWHTALLEKLCAHGIPGHLLLLEKYLHGRSFHIAVNE